MQVHEGTGCVHVASLLDSVSDFSTSMPGDGGQQLGVLALRLVNAGKATLANLEIGFRR